MLRLATLTDVSALNALIADSARGLSGDYYSPIQIEALITHVFGVDTQLIADSTYFMITDDETMKPIAAGGWSTRRTLHGGDQAETRDDTRLDPATDPARIRAFFVDPQFARRGLSRRLYDACEAAAKAAHFTRLELMATLPGEPLYAALGFTAVERTSIVLPNQVTVPLVRMERSI
jgi:GNAT superfamily N-acetyltransferase